METKFKGWKSQKYGNRNVYFLSTGPDPRGPMPGKNVHVVIYDTNGNVIRELYEQKGSCVEPGYVDFFNTAKCKPSVHEYEIIDADKDGKQTVLATHTTPFDAQNWLKANFDEWVNKHSETL